jgi:tetratricopeptide (TPR) repeat protein/transcriptional regulator with XRE-family HTH domain
MESNQEERTKNRMPTGGELLGEVVDMLNMMEIYEGEEWERDKKTAQRYLQGHTLEDSEQRVSAEAKEAVQKRFVDEMIPEGVMPRLIDKLITEPRDFLYMLTGWACDFWTRVANTLNGRQYRPDDPSLAYYGPIRLATVSLAFRWGVHEGVRQTSLKKAEPDGPVRGPDFNPGFLDPDAFQKLVDGHRDRSNEDLAEKVGVSKKTLYNWKSGDSVPSPSKVAWLAEAIAPNSYLSEEALDASLRISLLVSQAHRKLEDLLGEERMEDLKDVFWVVSKATAEYVEAGTGEDVQSDVLLLQDLLTRGTRCEGAKQVVSDVGRALTAHADKNSTLPVAFDLAGLQDWRGRLRHWDRVVFEVETLRGHREWPAEERITGGLLDGLEDGEALRRWIVANEYCPPLYSGSPSGRSWDDLPELSSPLFGELPELDEEAASRNRAARCYATAQSLVSVTRVEGALETIDEALEEVPDHPLLLERRGEYLFAMADVEQDPDMLREALNAFHKADCRSDGWGKPRLQMAHMMMFGGALQQAEAYLRRLEEHLDDDYLFHGIRGMNFYWLGEYDRAVESLERSRELAPGYGETHLMLAEAHRELGDKDAARRYKRNTRELLGIDEFDELEDPSERELSSSGLDDLERLAEI